MWNVDTNDWQYVGQSEANQISGITQLIRDCIAGCSTKNPNRGGIVLMHDYPHAFAISNVLDIMRSSSLNLRTVSQCVGYDAYSGNWLAKVLGDPVLPSPPPASSAPPPVSSVSSAPPSPSPISTQTSSSQTTSTSTTSNAYSNTRTEVSKSTSTSSTDSKNTATEGKIYIDNNRASQQRIIGYYSRFVWYLDIPSGCVNNIPLHLRIKKSLRSNFIFCESNEFQKRLLNNA